MRHRGLNSAKLQITNHKSQIPQRGYMLISLMLIFALMAVALLAVLPSIKQQVRRDREDELRHRGTMYMRAIQHFYKKNGRYPNSFEELEQTNHIRFLRKRYKDPMSWDPQTHKERDFKLLHMQDVLLNNGPVLGRPPVPGSLPGPGGSPNGPPQSPSGFQNTFGQTNQPGGTQQSPFQNPSNNPGSTDSSGSSNPGNGQGNSGSDNSGSSNPNSPNGGPNSTPGSGFSSPGSSAGGSGTGPSGQVFGGGAVVGVASTNKKDKAIHEFNKKTHYNEWYFIYDPSMDAYGLLIGPYQQLTIGGGGIGQPIAGAPGTGQQPSGFGQSPSGFGQSPNPSNPPNQQPPNGNPPNN